MAEKIRDARVRELDSVLDSQERRLRDEKGSLLVNVPRFAKRLNDLDGGEEVTVHTTDEDAIIIEL